MQYFGDDLILNQSKVNDMKEEIGQENIPVILSLFLSELEQYQQQLTTLPSEEIHDYLARICHSLKSSAASFGADALCQLALKYDAAVKQNQTLTTLVEGQQMRELLKITHTCYQVQVMSSS